MYMCVYIYIYIYTYIYIYCIYIYIYIYICYRTPSLLLDLLHRVGDVHRVAELAQLLALLLHLLELLLFIIIIIVISITIIIIVIIILITNCVIAIVCLFCVFNVLINPHLWLIHLMLIKLLVPRNNITSNITKSILKIAIWQTSGHLVAPAGICIFPAALNNLSPRD